MVKELDSDSLKAAVIAKQKAERELKHVQSQLQESIEREKKLQEVQDRGEGSFDF